MNNNYLSQISAKKLDGAGTCYAWSRPCLLYIKSRNLLGYINKEKKQHTANDNGFWDFDMAFKHYAPPYLLTVFIA